MKRIGGCIGLWMLLSALPVQGAERQLALWRLKPLGMDAATAERLETLLRAEAARLPGRALQARDNTETVLAGRPDLQTCGGETACLCSIGAALGVGELVTGVIGALGDDYTFDLKLIDVGACREVRRINEALSGREDLLIGAIRQALYKLVDPALVVGSLLVEVPVEGAEVQVDGRVVGTTPLREAVSSLALGAHRLRIVRAGLSTFEEEIQVRFQQTTWVKVDLVKSVLMGLSYEKESPVAAVVPPLVVAPPPEKGLSALAVTGWSCAGVAGAAAIAAGILGWRSQVAEDEVEQAASATVPYLTAAYADTIKRGERLALGANISWGLTGAAGVAAVVLLVVDWVSGDEPATAGEVSAPAAGLRPALLPQGGGVMFEGRF